MINCLNERLLKHLNEVEVLYNNDMSLIDQVIEQDP